MRLVALIVKQKVQFVNCNSRYLFCLQIFKNPLKGIELSVNSIGADTDSIGAFAGGLLGALHGDSIIPSKWKKVQDYEYLSNVSMDLFKIFKKI